jgi:hypothetical protein
MQEIERMQVTEYLNASIFKLILRGFKLALVPRKEHLAEEMGGH